MYFLGTGLLGLLGMVLVPQTRLGEPSTALAIITLYVLAQVWLWFSHQAYQRHWYQYFAQGALLLVPSLLFAAMTLVRTGVHAIRQARLIIQQLLLRADWPADHELIQALPEVLALREVLQTDASPALALLHNARPELQVAALSALAYRRRWQSGQEEMVLQVAQQAPDPSVRVAAITALVHCADRFLLESVAEFLHDLSPRVRRAAVAAVFAGAERHWSTLRFIVHKALSDPHFRKDGALPLPSGELPAQVLADLHEWAAEGGGLARRASQTLAAYYGQLLHSRADADSLAEELRQKLLDPKLPPVLRVDLAHLLHDQHLLDAATLEPLLAADQPVALRLLAADALLAAGVHSEAERALYDVARLPNREITLSAAQIVQRRLGVDLGLNLQKIPAVQSRQAAEIARRVMEWAASAQPRPADESHPPAEPEPPRRVSTESDWDIRPLPDLPDERHGTSGMGVSRW
jgi:hypothetical protein